MHRLPVSLSHAIRRVRREHGLTRSELAERCGISLRHLASIEAGANFSVAVLLAIAEVFDGAELPIGTLSLSRARRHETGTPRGAVN